MAEILLSEAEKAFIHHGVQVKHSCHDLFNYIFFPASKLILKKIQSRMI